MDEAALRVDMIERLEHDIGESLGERVLSALGAVPRETFVSSSPYGADASQEEGTRALAPATVARMLTALDAREGDETLIVGAGVGYTAAALAEIVGSRHVHAVDVDRDAVHLARSNLADAGYDAVLVDRRNGVEGLPEYAPFDRVLLEAAVVRPPRALIDQLSADGRIVYPKGTGVQTVVAAEPTVADREERGPDDFAVVEEAGPARLHAMLAEGERGGVERNRTRREDAERADQGHFARAGWEQDWIDWDRQG
ncbi:protein-L-isoaspartate O-methyltransferase family protein [Haloparvum sedimenti]|uniref:protein-L-isoaspartate O-methyltransferase family protein n=1 Tax=Haloparvum sedimenti TaxID=1678448 RepID=UPI00071E9166|nr:methyltransferase [Haloparvum sedimenti]